METSINQLTDYFAQAPMVFYDIYAPTVPSGGRQTNWRTNGKGAGLVFPLMGCSRYTLDGTPYVLEPGVVLHAGPDTPLSKEVIGEGFWRYALIHFYIPQSEVARFPLYYEHFLIHTGNNARIADLVSQLHQSYAAPGGIAALKSKVLFTGLIEEMMISAKRRLYGSDTEPIIQAVEYIRQNYTSPLSVSELSDRFGLERRRFAYLFERHIGMSPNRYITECRLRRAKDLLRTCACPISQVAECVGYTDSFYFSRLFKRQTGLSPTEFRQTSTEST